MNFFKRALLSIQRRKSKSLILFLVIFILGNLMAGAIAIQQASQHVEAEIKTRLGANATVSFNQEKLQKLSEEGTDIDIKEPDIKVYKELGKLDQVKFYDYSVIDYITTEKLKNVVSKDDDSILDINGIHYFTVKGASRPELIDVQMKKISLIEGNTFSQEEIEKGLPVAVISEKVAKENNLHVGDSFVMDRVIEHYGTGNVDVENIERKSKEYSATVVGIFTVNQVEKKENSSKNSKQIEQEQNQQIDYYDKLNVIYFPNDYIEKTQKEMLEFNYDNFPDNFSDENSDIPDKETVLKDFSFKNIQATYVQNKPEEVEDFKLLGNQILKDNKLDYYKIEASSDQFDSIAGPIKGMANISKIVLIVSVMASIFIITLVIILFLRDRKHELGIYLSLGEKRNRVVGQIVTEVLLVAIIAMTLSVFSGNVLAKNFSESLMTTQQIDNTEDEMMIFGSPVVDFQITEDDVIDAYDIKLTPSYIALFYLIGLIVVLLSTIVPLVYIMRLNPKKIMM